MASDQQHDHLHHNNARSRAHVRIYSEPSKNEISVSTSVASIQQQPISAADSFRGNTDVSTSTKEVNTISLVPKSDVDSGASDGDGDHCRSIRAFSKRLFCKFKFRIPRQLAWIPANLSWSRWKPALRSALAAWILLVIFVIPKVERWLGQAAFLMIIASFMVPPSDPFVAVLERECIILVLGGLGWAWLTLGLKAASLVRTTQVSNATVASITTGQYLEVAPSVIIAIFMFLGSVFYLYVRARQGPGQFFFPCVLNCLCMDMAFTTAVLYPYPYYRIGQTIMLPIILHAVVSLLTSILAFPSSMSALFARRVHTVLLPLTDTVPQHRECLVADVTSSDFSVAPIMANVDKAEGGLASLSSAARLLKIDITYNRIAPTDFDEIHRLSRRLLARANGMIVYYTLIDPTRERFPVTPAPSVPGTPSHSPMPSRIPSLDLSYFSGEIKEHIPVDVSSKHCPRRGWSRSHTSTSGQAHRHQLGPYNHYHHHRILHSSILQLSFHRSHKTLPAVGVFEAHRYLNLETTRLSHPDSQKHIAKATELLGACCQDLLLICESALRESCDWVLRSRSHHFNFWISRAEKERIREDHIKRLERLLGSLSRELDEFTTRKRLRILEPYYSMFNSSNSPTTYDDIPPHRYLFHCYVYQFHLMRFAVLLQDLLKEIIRLDTERKHPRLWFPSLGVFRLSFLSTWEPQEDAEINDDENPERIPGINPSVQTELGQAVRRDPDALPPRNALEAIASRIYYMVAGVGGGNALFAIKAGVLVVLLMLPGLMKSSVQFAYEKKFVWAVFMAQTTLSRFRGDTVIGVIGRILSTLCGGVIGTVVWYLSTGSGTGNAYGLAAVCLACYPAFFFVRLYWPVGPTTSMITFTTIGLVIGYSYQNALTGQVFPGWGFDLAWIRFVLVAVGVSCAGVFSYLPPSTTIRSYQRRSLATTTAQLGSVYCSVISFTSTRRGDDTVIIESLLAIRSKLKRISTMTSNAMYEYTLRGKWPAERYRKVLEIQLQLTYLLSHLLSVVEELEPAWARAFLTRTRLLDPEFQGGVLAVISLISTSLRTGDPLPQVTPCPLLDRFMERYDGFGVTGEDAEEDFGLPKQLTPDVLESLQYLTFCVGVSTTFAIVCRLDRLMIATKELVGEQYHIDGVALPLHNHSRPAGIPIGTPTMSLGQM